MGEVDINIIILWRATLWMVALCSAISGDVASTTAAAASRGNRGHSRKGKEEIEGEREREREREREDKV
jgi:hypothetical protein